MADAWKRVVGARDKVGLIGGLGKGQRTGCGSAGLVGSPEMRSAMGASREQLKSLREDGILLPRTTHPSIRAPWRIADGLALVAELEALACLIPSTDEAWEGIQAAHMRTGLRAGEIIAAIRSGKLKIGVRTMSLAIDHSRS